MSRPRGHKPGAGGGERPFHSSSSTVHGKEERQHERVGEAFESRSMVANKVAKVIL